MHYNKNHPLTLRTQSSPNAFSVWSQNPKSKLGQWKEAIRLVIRWKEEQVFVQIIWTNKRI